MIKKKDIKKNISNRLKELAKLIEKHNYYYHTKDKPIINDRDYDKLVIENSELESTYPDLKLKKSPSNKVGSLIENKFTKSNHLSPMHSLSNGFNENDLLEFDERIKKFLNIQTHENLEYICEPKIDGLSLNLTYKKGILISENVDFKAPIRLSVNENTDNGDFFSSTKLSYDTQYSFLSEDIENRVIGEFFDHLFHSQ